jgi:lipoprotein-releasing system permease protein
MLLSRFQPFEWIVASRFLREGRMQSLFIIVGIAIGVAVIVFMSALLQGLQTNLVKRVLTAQAHIQVLPPKQTARIQHGTDAALHADQIQAPLQRLQSIDQWQAVLHVLRAMPEVHVASPTVAGSTLITRGAASRALSLTAVDLALYQQIINLSEKIVAGQARLDANDILIGTELAADLGLGVGDKLLVQSATGASNYFVIAGILDLGNKGANQRTGFVALHSGQSLLGYPGGVTVIDLTLNDVYAAEAVALTAGSRPTRNFSVPSSRKAWPILPSAFLWACRSPLALPACWWFRWCSVLKKLASCAPWAFLAGK